MTCLKFEDAGGTASSQTTDGLVCFRGFRTRRESPPLDSASQMPPTWLTTATPCLSLATTYWRAAANSAWNCFALSGWCKASNSAARSSHASRRNFIDGLVCLDMIP